MSERTLLSGRSWAGKLVPKPPCRCHPPISFSFSPLVLLLSLRLIDRDDLLFCWRQSSSVIHAAALPTHPLTDGVNHESYSKLWQRLCVHSSRQHVSALITRHPALNVCCLTPVATELANKDVYQCTPPQFFLGKNMLPSVTPRMTQNYLYILYLRIDGGKVNSG